MIKRLMGKRMIRSQIRNLKKKSKRRKMTVKMKAIRSQVHKKLRARMRDQNGRSSSLMRTITQSQMDS